MLKLIRENQEAILFIIAVIGMIEYHTAIARGLI